MNRFFVVVMALAGWCLAGNNPTNWHGVLDTVAIRDTIEADTIKYTSALVMTDGEDVRVLLKMRDTSTAGYGNDSLEMEWGYQLGTLTRDTAGTADTLWDSRIIIDTVSQDSLGRDSAGYCLPTGAMTRYWNQHTDTTDVTGYAVQDRWYVPEWAEVVRYWVKGLADNNEDSPLILIFEHHQRLFVPVRRM